ncbi:FeoA family protein [Crocosphaera sp. UHCC 0190]|uniref:FeoA family protein n=1 Tax=Crocosphaera sp. UHCC 0190 TaxID=3110246 RepID=UPI002B214B08|nr:FeoA family protein [Crocosphaera sp. UHCC 0190]MEA5511006.1 FeoA family protein [Crocosphaera sp. UHCC 0190]
MMQQTRTSYLRELPIGAKGYIVGYDKIFRGYQGKLLSMGLTPGTEFILVRQASIDWPMMIEVKGNLLKLQKPEADALCIEENES